MLPHWIRISGTNQYNTGIIVPSCLEARAALVASRDDELGHLSDRQGLSYKKDHQVDGQKDMLYLPKAQGHVQPLGLVWELVE
jgi:hypothetical protein